MPPSVADLDRLRAAGWPSHAPLRWRVIESLAGRAAASDDALRLRLEARVAALLADYGAAMAARTGQAAGRHDGHTATGGAPDVEDPPPAGAATATGRPLAALLAHIAAQSSPTGELRTLVRFRRTWSRLAAEQRVMRSRLNLPRNAGPLNSQHLVHRAMTLMHALSPEYLERFVAHADALLWLDRASGGDLPLEKDPATPGPGAGSRGAARGGSPGKAGGTRTRPGDRGRGKAGPRR